MENLGNSSIQYAEKSDLIGHLDILLSIADENRDDFSLLREIAGFLSELANTDMRWNTSLSEKKSVVYEKIDAFQAKYGHIGRVHKALEPVAKELETFRTNRANHSETTDTSPTTSKRKESTHRSTTRSWFSPANPTGRGYLGDGF